VRKRAQLGNLRLHDLRHTGATWLAMQNANAHVIQQALQHSSLSTSQRYVHLVGAPNMVRDQLAKAQSAV
jgi:integrase